MKKSKPLGIRCGCAPMDVAMQRGPTPLVAAALVDGSVALKRLEGEHAKARSAHESLRLHEDSCRAVDFFPQSSSLITGGVDGSLRLGDVETGKAVRTFSEAHEEGLTRVLALDPHMFASGDEAGVVQRWDARASSSLATAKIELHEHGVSDFKTLPGKHALLSTGGDGTLAFVDSRTFKVRAKSEGGADDEFLAVETMRHGTKVVCGSGSGVLHIFSWGFWSDCSALYPGHPDAVESLIRLDDEALITGCSDGLIRVVSVVPNRMIGVLGSHKGGGVVKLALSEDARWLASAGLDDRVRFWDIGAMEVSSDEEEGGAWSDEESEAEQEGDAGEDSDEEEASGEEQTGKKRKVGKDSDSDDSDDQKRRVIKGRPQRGDHKIVNNRKVTKRNSFFKDLF